MRVAREIGLPLKLAGKMHDPLEREHFDATCGRTSATTSSTSARCRTTTRWTCSSGPLLTVFPIQWPEPFGLVMVESMACGTPVLATALGAVPEVVEHGRGGLVSETVDELIGHVDETAGLDRRGVRAVAEERFSASGWSRSTSRPTSA